MFFFGGVAKCWIHTSKLNEGAISSPTSLTLSLNINLGHPSVWFQVYCRDIRSVGKKARFCSAFLWQWKLIAGALWALLIFEGGEQKSHLQQRQTCKSELQALLKMGKRIWEIVEEPSQQSRGASDRPRLHPWISSLTKPLRSKSLLRDGP